MAGLAPCTPLERLALERDALVAWLARQFPRSLSIEDAEDLVGDALPALAADRELPAGGRARRAYLHRALRRDAIDELRRRHGRNLLAGPRALVPLDAAERVSDPGADPDRAIDDREALEQKRETVQRTLPRLRADDAEVLRLRYLEQRSPDDIAEQLGISRTQYERRLARAGSRGFDVVASTQSGPACSPVRELIDREPPEPLGRDDAARVEVHLADCLHCRAFALRTRGLLEALPALGLVERLGARVAALLGRGGDAALRGGQEAALAGGAAGAGTAISAGLGTKLAVSCASVAVAAVCAGPLAHEFTPERTGTVAARTGEPDRPKRERARPRAAATPQPTAAAAIATSTATPSATATASPTRTATPRRSTRQERRRRNREAAVHEFGPEAATPQVTATTATARAASTQTHATPPPPPRPVPKRTNPPASSSFSEEFRP